LVRFGPSQKKRSRNRPTQDESAICKKKNLDYVDRLGKMREVIEGESGYEGKGKHTKGGTVGGRRKQHRALRKLGMITGRRGTYLPSWLKRSPPPRGKTGLTCTRRGSRKQKNKNGEDCGWLKPGQGSISRKGWGDCLGKATFAITKRRRDRGRMQVRTLENRGESTSVQKEENDPGS